MVFSKSHAAVIGRCDKLRMGMPFSEATLVRAGLKNAKGKPPKVNDRLLPHGRTARWIRPEKSCDFSCFSTGRASPVTAASFTWQASQRSTRPSQGTVLPAFSSTWQVETHGIDMCHFCLFFSNKKRFCPVLHVFLDWTRAGEALLPSRALHFPGQKRYCLTLFPSIFQREVFGPNHAFGTEWWKLSSFSQTA